MDPPAVCNAEVILELSRKFQKLHVNNLDAFDLEEKRAAVNEKAKSLVKIISKHGSQIRELNLNFPVFNSIAEFREIMINLPLLEKVVVNGLQCMELSKKEISDSHPILMTLLKSVSITNSNFEIFKCFTAPKMNHFELDSTDHELDGVKDFLKAVVGLESMDVSGWQLIESNPKELKLKKLRVGSKFCDKSEKVFLKFLKSQSASLEYLELPFISGDVLAEIFSQPGHLKTLVIGPSKLPIDEEFYKKLRTFRRLKEFRLSNYRDDRIVKGILGNCPNVEILQLPFLFNPSELLPFITINNPKLKKLTIFDVRAEIGPEVQFKFLTHLQVESVRHLKFAVNLIENTPSIETLKLQHDGFVNLGDLNELLNQPSLKHLKLCGSAWMLKKIYDAIKVDYKKLKTLELETADGMKFFFRFPVDSSQWNPNCRYFDTLNESALI